MRKEKAYGRDVKRRSDFVAKGSGDMEKWIYFPLAVDFINKNGFKKVLDLGCGDATFLTNLCESNDEVTGYGIDIAPEAIVMEERGSNRLVFKAEFISSSRISPNSKKSPINCRV